MLSAFADDEVAVSFKFLVWKWQQLLVQHVPPLGHTCALFNLRMRCRIIEALTNLSSFGDAIHALIQKHYYRWPFFPLSFFEATWAKLIQDSIFKQSGKRTANSIDKLSRLSAGVVAVQSSSQLFIVLFGPFQAIILSKSEDSYMAWKSDAFVSGINSGLPGEDFLGEKTHTPIWQQLHLKWNIWK